MALMTWDSNKYSVGVKSIDSQHCVLFRHVNDLYEAMREGQGQKFTGTLLQKLVDYTQTHFTAEEKLMAAAAYPKLAEHKARHHDLIKQVSEFVSRFERGEIGLSLDMMTFLSDWLSKHIQHEDMEYRPWMNQHGMR